MSRFLLAVVLSCAVVFAAGCQTSHAASSAVTPAPSGTPLTVAERQFFAEILANIAQARPVIVEVSHIAAQLTISSGDKSRLAKDGRWLSALSVESLSLPSETPRFQIPCTDYETGLSNWTYAAQYVLAGFVRSSFKTLATGRDLVRAGEGWMKKAEQAIAQATASQ